MILRRHGSAYRLVSDCHIDGLMDGEVVDMWQNGELELKSFEIFEIEHSLSRKESRK